MFNLLYFLFSALYLFYIHINILLNEKNNWENMLKYLELCIKYNVEGNCVLEEIHIYLC